jgi:glutamate---cysteine ligase / carboxylate-amine ligase
MSVRSVGVEEELLLVEPGTGQPRSVAGTVLQAAAGAGRDTNAGAPGQDATDALELELQQEQLETRTEPCHALEELGGELRRCRASAVSAAGRAGVQVAALATSPVPVEPRVVENSRYQKMAEAFGLTAHEQLTCGCHVHVEVCSDDEGVAVLDRIGPWLAILLALSANSPFWQGTDSAYASFRYQAWGRWPSSGPTGMFGTVPAYREVVQQMVRTGTLLDTGMIYFDARLSEHYPTIEIRIADVCLNADDARPELLRLAAWRASRSGLDDALLNPVTGRPEEAVAVVHTLLDHVSDALSEAGDSAAVTELLAAVLARGNGAVFQRAAYRRSSQLSDVVSSAITATGT